MSYQWRFASNRLILAGFVALIIGGCTFPPPDPWSLPIHTIEVPVRGESGQAILPYLLEIPDSIRIACPPQIQVTVDLKRDTLIVKSLAEKPGYYLVSLSSGKKTAALAIRVTPRFAVDFRYGSDPGSTHDVSVVGSFNGWGKDPLPLHDLDRDGIYENATWLSPQRHRYNLVVDGVWIRDPDNPASAPGPEGGVSSVLDLRDSTAYAPGFFIRTDHTGRQFTFTYFQPSRAKPIDPQSIIVLVDNLKLPRQQWTFDEQSALLHITFHLKTSGFVRILAQDRRGRMCRETQFLLKNGRTVSASSPLDTWYTKTIYSVLTDRFFDGDPYDNWSLRDPDVPPLTNFFGGDLEGLRYKIEDGYFDSLGLGAICISPLNQGPDSAYFSVLDPRHKQTGYHGHWPVQSSRVELRIGGRPAAQEFVQSAHQHDLKVMLDFVAQHTHRLHPWFSDHRDWYQAKWLADSRDSSQLSSRLPGTWSETYLPAFDYLHSPAALNTMTDNALWWISTYNVDGLRHHAVDQVPERFWITLSRKLREQFPGNTPYQLGHTPSSPGTPSGLNINSAQLDGQLNLEQYYRTREIFALGSGSMTDVAWTIEQNLISNGSLNLMGTFAGSQDHPRFISLADRKISFTENPMEAAWSHPPTPAGATAHERLRLYYAFILTLPGVPIVYYGDEIGMAGAGNPDNRRPMKWSAWTDNEQTTFTTLSRLIRLRRNHPALAVGDLVIATATNDVLVYRRIGFEEEFLVVLNKGDEQRNFIPPGSDVIWENRFGGNASISGGVEAVIAPRSCLIFQLAAKATD